MKKNIKKIRLRSRVSALLMRSAVLAAAFLTASTLLAVIIHILSKGVPALGSDGIFDPVYSSQNASMFPSIINTCIMTFLSLGLALPLGIFSAIYLAEYADRSSVPVKLIRLTAETLAGIPSIVYGLFGYILFVITLGWGYTLLSGAITLAIMILPLIMRTTEVALLSVPDSYREGSYGLGAGRLRTSAGGAHPREHEPRQRFRQAARDSASLSAVHRLSTQPQCDGVHNACGI